MRREMEREFEEQFKDIENRAPKDLVREYETAGGGKVREYGPFVYGYSIDLLRNYERKSLHDGQFCSFFRVTSHH
jgi:hypothetical protein